MTALPDLPQHPLRAQLNQELHARPPIALAGPAWISLLAVLHEGFSAADEEAHLDALCGLLGCDACPRVEGGHWVLESDRLQVKWERHNEFSTYTFYLHRDPHATAETTALEAFPAEWTVALPGRVIAAAHVEFCRPAQRDPAALLDELGRRNDAVVVSRVADGAALVTSDFRLHDGFSRFVVIDEHLRHRQAGRTVQRLLEIETYRMMALLAFPVAREVGGALRGTEAELSELMRRISEAPTPEEERAILADLTRLAADVEHTIARTAFRFGAAAAYHRLVQQRIDELREVRLSGFPPIGEFMSRRLAPAIDTCASVARRQDELSDRIARSSQLLRTRVDIELERQNQALLEQMNRRTQLQLRLQQTVEGLSVVAITYYASQLVSYLAKGAKGLLPWSWLSPEVLTALSIPLIAALVFAGLHRMRHRLENADRHS